LTASVDMARGERRELKCKGAFGANAAVLVNKEAARIVERRMIVDVWVLVVRNS